MKAVLGHGTGPCAMERLIQLINYCSCLPQHQSRDPLAPAARAKREGIFNYSWTASSLCSPWAGSTAGNFPCWSSWEIHGSHKRGPGCGKPGSHLGSTSCPGCWIHIPAASPACLSPAWIPAAAGFLLACPVQGGKGVRKVVRMAAGSPHLLVRIIKHSALNESLGITADPHMLCFSKLPDSSPCSLYKCPVIVSSSRARSQCYCWDSFQKKKINCQTDEALLKEQICLWNILFFH